MRNSPVGYKPTVPFRNLMARSPISTAPSLSPRDKQTPTAIAAGHGWRKAQ